MYSCRSSQTARHLLAQSTLEHHVLYSCSGQSPEEIWGSQPSSITWPLGSKHCPFCNHLPSFCPIPHNPFTLSSLYFFALTETYLSSDTPASLTASSNGSHFLSQTLHITGSRCGVVSSFLLIISLRSFFLSPP